MNRVDISCYGPIGSWFGLTAQDVLAQLRAAPDAEEILVRIHSDGGDAMEGLAICSALRAHRGRKIIMVDGLAASAASVILTAGDQVIVSPGALVMLHDAWRVAAGDAQELRAQAEMLDKVSQAYSAEYARKTRKTPEEMRAVMCAHSFSAGTWLTAAEAVELGLADTIGAPVQIQARALSARAANSAAARFAPVAASTARNGMSKEELNAALGLGEDPKPEEVKEAWSKMEAAYAEHYGESDEEDPEAAAETEEEPEAAAESDEEKPAKPEKEPEASAAVKALASKVDQLTNLVKQMAEGKAAAAKREERGQRASTSVRAAGAPAPEDFPDAQSRARAASPATATASRIMNRVEAGVRSSTRNHLKEV